MSDLGEFVKHLFEAITNLMEKLREVVETLRSQKAKSKITETPEEDPRERKELTPSYKGQVVFKGDFKEYD